MANTPTYREASFKGVNFQVSDTDMELGRRGALHEYVNEDIPYFEDLGRKASRFNVSAYVRGENHLSDALALQRAINAEGAGQLVLPNRITENVYCVSASRSDALKDAILETRFSLEFVEAGEFRFPSGFLDSVVDLVESAAIAAASVVEDVAFAANSFAAAAQDVFDAGASIGSSVRSIIASGNDLASLASAMRAIGEASAPSSAIRALLPLTTFESAVAPISAGVVTQGRFQAEQDFDRAVRVTAAIEAARTVSRLEFTNRLDAINLRDQIADAIERDYAHLGADQARAMADLRGRLFTDFAARIVTLPAFIQVDMGESIPSVVAAQEIFGDYTREADLRTWNQTIHPLFMPQVIEALR